MQAFEAELCTDIYAIELAEQFSWKDIWLAYYSAYVVQVLIRRINVVMWSLQNRWMVFNRYLQLIRFQIMHIYRERNQVANLLSKATLSSEEESWSFSIPGYCITTHEIDIFGGQNFLVYLLGLWGFSFYLLFARFLRWGCLQWGFFS